MVTLLSWCDTVDTQLFRFVWHERLPALKCVHRWQNLHHVKFFLLHLFIEVNLWPLESVILWGFFVMSAFFSFFTNWNDEIIFVLVGNCVYHEVVNFAIFLSFSFLNLAWLGYFKLDKFKPWYVFVHLVKLKTYVFVLLIVYVLVAVLKLYVSWSVCPCLWAFSVCCPNPSVFLSLCVCLSVLVHNKLS
jgi:hypothetical protein